MQQTQKSTTQIKHWATKIQERGLTSLAVPLLDLLQVWGFVGAQLCWMLRPFVGERIPSDFAEALEQPEILQQLQQCLVQGDTLQ